jgi:ABC-2 type transport system ATP-binding protein
MSNAIEVDELTKVFGKQAAVDHLSLTVEQGSVFGFLGPNGAGKTTTQRLLTGLARPTSGTARILGYDVVKDASAVRKVIGFLPDVPSFYGWMTADEYLGFVAGIFNLPTSASKRKIEQLLDLTGLTGVGKKIGGYSRGMKQRLGIAQALMNDPEVILMDEPTSALDPIGRKEVLELIGSLGKEITVFFSTHILNDVERVCDSVAILNKGKLMTEANLDTLKEGYAKPSFTIEFESNPSRFEESIKDLAWIEKIERTESFILTVKTKDIESGQKELPRLIADSGVALKSFQTAEPSLEEIFMNMMGEA